MITAKYENAVEQNGVCIVRTPKGVGVGWAGFPAFTDRPLKVEVYYQGRLYWEELLNPINEIPWRNHYGDIDHLRCWLRVKDGETILAELGLPAEEFIHPFMVRSIGPQQHITENYISVPPALTITDEVGAVWTFGFVTATKDQSPEGEFAFDVLRDGMPTGAIASRIERRNGKIRAFTKRGWLIWSGREFL